MFISKSIRVHFDAISDAGADNELISLKLGIFRGSCIFYKDRITLRRPILPTVTLYYKDASLTFTKPASAYYKKIKYTFTFYAPQGRIYIDGRRFALEDNERVVALIEKIYGKEVNDSVYKSELSMLQV